MLKKINVALSCTMMGLVAITMMDTKKAVAVQELWQTTEKQRVSVHDPSIMSVIDEAGKENFYIFGSHLAEAKSTNLKTWQVPFTKEYGNMTNDPVLGNVDENLKESFKWAGKDDANSAGGYAIWAPDVIWNPNYVWENGDRGAYMYYYSTSSTWRRSCIGYAVSREVEGTYHYVDTIVYSGFTEKDATDGSTRNVNYRNTHLPRLIQEGRVAGFNPDWSKDNGTTYNTDIAPNAIDPALFFDANGKMWMTYGSWSGGIYLLEINQQTGQPIYPKVDKDLGNGVKADRYFGIKLSGGYHRSGEGPFIEYDPTTKYYYLFETYGGLLAEGGYNMRVFRSRTPEGPYVDAKGWQPLFGPTTNNDHYGVKVMGGYRFNDMVNASKAQGHNSVIRTKSGQWHLVYHTRFDNSGEYHEVRVHSMYMNEEQWPVATPYEYEGGERKIIDRNQMIGTYQFINHGTATTPKVSNPQAITFEADGRVSGYVSGNWQLKSDGYLTITIDGVVYKGRAIYQKNEAASKQDVVTFSAIGDNNKTIWGVKN